jgi:hypothetical protein
MFEATFNWGHILTFLGLVLTATGLVLTALAIWSNTKAQRAKFLFDIYNSYPENETAFEIHCKIDYHEFEEWRDEWQDSEYDTGMTTLLWYYDLIAYLFQESLLKGRERELFQHDQEIFAASEGVKQYIAWLKKYDEENGVNTVRFPCFEKWINEAASSTSNTNRK